MQNISQTFDKGYLIAGTSSSQASGDKTENNLGTEQTCLVKTDSLGNKQWDKTIFTNGQYYEMGFAIQTKDGCYVIANSIDGGIGGYKTQPSWGVNDYWIVKFCDSTSVVENISSFTSDNNADVTIYPNPASQSVTISWPSSIGGNINVTVVNVLGEKVHLQQPQTSNFKPQTVFDVSSLPNGVYFLKIDWEDRSVNKKFVVAHD